VRALGIGPSGDAGTGGRAARGHIPDELQQSIIRRQEIIERQARETRETLERLRQDVDLRRE
jgi:hypothetical protein